MTNVLQSLGNFGSIPVVVPPTATPVPDSTANGNPNAKLAVAGASEIYPVDFQAEFTSLAANAPSVVGFWRAAVRKVARQNYVIGCAMHGTLAGESIADFSCGSGVTGNVKERLKAYFQQTLAQCESLDRPVFRNDVILSKTNIPLAAFPLRIKSPLALDSVLCFAIQPPSERDLLLTIKRLHSLLLQASQHIAAAHATSRAETQELGSLDFREKSSEAGDTREFAEALLASISARKIWQCLRQSLRQLVHTVRYKTISVGNHRGIRMQPSLTIVNRLLAHAREKDAIDLSRANSDSER